MDKDFPTLASSMSKPSKASPPRSKKIKENCNDLPLVTPQLAAATIEDLPIVASSISKSVKASPLCSKNGKENCRDAANKDLSTLASSISKSVKTSPLCSNNGKDIFGDAANKDLSTMAPNISESVKASSSRSHNSRDKRRDANHREECMVRHPIEKDISQMPLPLRALASRIKSSSSNSNWLSYIPEGLQHFFVESNNFYDEDQADRGDGAPILAAEAEDMPYSHYDEAIAHQQPGTVFLASFDEGLTFQEVTFQEVCFPQQYWPVDGVQDCACYPVAILDQSALELGYAEPAQSSYISQCKGNVWKLSQDRHSTWNVQEAILHCDERLELALELQGHVWEACKCPHANHVLQCCINNIPAEHMLFVVDEIMDREGGVRKIAKNQYGCRVLQRLLEHCSHEQEKVTSMVEALLSDTVMLTMHEFGNFVVGHLLEYCGLSVASRVIDKLVESLPEMAADGQLGRVAEKAFRTPHCPENRISLANSIVCDCSCLVPMACSRFGHSAAREAFNLAAEPVRIATSIELTSKYANRLRYNRYGKPLLKEAQAMNASSA